MKNILATFALALLLTVQANAQESFVVEDVRVDGLQRITAGTVFNYLPIKVGESVDALRVDDAIRILYKTGFFKQIALSREGSVLVVKVIERPSIAKIEVSGNKDIETPALREGLKHIGLDEGLAFNRSILSKMEQELQRQYFSQGKYAVQIKSTVKDIDKNRVEISIQISEGQAAAIQQINIVGNTAYSDEDLLDEFQLQSTDDVSFFGSGDQYSKQKLSADIETLRSYYMDRGYVGFLVKSTQVSITPDRSGVYITINVSEGKQFSIASTALVGDLVLDREELRGLIDIKAGDVFARKRVTDSVNRISERLGEEGFAFTNVNAVPEIDEVNQQVAITFYVDPGRRVYVRRINMLGNNKTRDEVLRRELRQMEGGWIDTKKVKRSKTRLERLSFFQDVNVETPPVPGVSDQVDINYSVVERASGNLTAAIGYSQSAGVIFSLGVSQDNFLGSGNRVSFKLENSDVEETYTFSHTNPFYTIDGVSRSFSIFSKKSDAAEADIINYEIDTVGASVRYGIPLNEFDRVSAGFGFENMVFRLPTTPAVEVSDFVTINGDSVDTVTGTLSWSHDTRDKTIFPNSGTKLRLALEAALPGGNLQYYKLEYQQHWHQKLWGGFGLGLKGNVAYAEAYGDTASVPFFERYYAGGGRSVRGYKGNSIGLRNELGDPRGGDFKVVGNIELVLPLLEDQKSVRFLAFLDGGGVFIRDEQEISADDLRYSYGVQAEWFSPVGPLTFTFAEAIDPGPDDDTQSFQFLLGVPF